MTDPGIDLAAATRRARRAAAALAALLALAAASSAPLVPPGGLVRWPGEDLERCELEGRTWEPLAAACWYPIDLLRPAGEMVLARHRAGVKETARVRVDDYPYPVQQITIRDPTQVDLSAADLERVRREQALVAALWSRGGSARFSLPLAPPLASMPKGGRFGARRVFNRQPRSPHTGADYPADEGTSVRAVEAGTVALAADLFFSGKSLFIDHGDGLISMYFHLSEALAGEGQEVRRGEPIGRVGQSGRATGPHLHFGVRWRGARIDPAPLFGPPELVPTPQ